MISWLKNRYPDLTYEVPVWYPSTSQPDHREWLITNGLGGFAAGTIAGAHRRRYHALLISALNQPRDRHLILSRIDETVFIDGQEFELATNAWASGVISPRGYRLIESFTMMPSPTWVFALGKHHLVKQICFMPDTDEIHVGYHFLRNPDAPVASAEIRLHFLTAFRSFHSQIRGSSDFHYPQFVSPKGSVVRLSESDRRLCLTWSHGEYEPMRQWWWDYSWAEETARGEKDTEDLLFVGRLSADIARGIPLEIVASADKPVDLPDLSSAVNATMKKQRRLIDRAALGNELKRNLLLVSSDQFVVKKEPDGDESYIIRGYPWFSDYGRFTLISIPGLLLATNRLDDAKKTISSLTAHMRNGLLPRRFLESSGQPEYEAADVTLFWAYALFHYVKVAKDLDFIAEQLPLMKEAAKHYLEGTNEGIAVDINDGLLRINKPNAPLTWMDAQVAEFAITPRSGKPVEIQALWYNFIATVIELSQIVDKRDRLTQELEFLRDKCAQSLEKFWNEENQCLFDVIETNGDSNAVDASVRPNQLFAVSLPFRALTAAQEKAVLTIINRELLTDKGLRTLSPQDESYQASYGCGLPRADQYHRDLSYYQGTVWPFLLGMYFDALINVFGPLPETRTKIAILMQPLLENLAEDAAIGSISEIFDGDKPHLSRGCFADAAAVGEMLRWHKWCLKNAN